MTGVITPPHFAALVRWFALPQYSKWISTTAAFWIHTRSTREVPWHQGKADEGKGPPAVRAQLLTLLHILPVAGWMARASTPPFAHKGPVSLFRQKISNTVRAMCGPSWTLIFWSKQDSDLTLGLIGESAEEITTDGISQWCINYHTEPYKANWGMFLGKDLINKLNANA